MLHIYLKYASYWLYIWSKYGYEGDLTTLGYDICVCVQITQFHAYLMCLNAYLAVFCESVSRCFQQGEGPYRGLLRVLYCKTSRSPRPSLAPSCLGLCLSSFQNIALDGRVIMTSAAELHPVCPSITHTIKYKIFQNNNCMSCSPTRLVRGDRGI